MKDNVKTTRSKSMKDIEKNNILKKIENYQEKTKNLLITSFLMITPIFFGFVLGIFPIINKQIFLAIPLKIIFFITCSLFVASICKTINYLLYMIQNAEKAKYLILNDNYNELIDLTNEDTIKENRHINLVTKSLYISLFLILIIIIILLGV